jgi:hypothetical protein
MATLLASETSIRLFLEFYEKSGRGGLLDLSRQDIFNILKYKIYFFFIPLPAPSPHVEASPHESQ